MAKRECGSLGLPDMPLVVLPHPTSALLGEEARAKAREVVNEVAHVITQNAPKLAAEYNKKIYPAPKRKFRAKQVFD